ncbi:MAG: ATP-binding protein [Verrucomicrobiaceae bacterium]|nr:MAG: ATP-binding protein [Verrucomicrobiaceae bacterium]
MTISSADYEKLGQFYLGRDYDTETKKVGDDLILYDSKDLVTHGVVLGMTGSGKTGLCLALLEEAAMDNIPAIVIDPKGDISNLLLTFPDLDAKSFRPWINEDDAAKKGITPDEHAAKTAEMWKTGLADWGQQPERVAQFRDKVDINIFTPGSKAGIPVSILSSLEVPPFEIMDDAELLGERVESTVSSLLSLVGVNADAIQSPEAVLVAAIFQHAWAAEQNVTLETLIRHIQKPSFDKVGVIDLESFMPEKARQSLALKFNNLLASPGFATWLEGPPLDIARMLHTPAGKPRISIFSIAHLGDTERMFFVSLLLNQMLGWMRAQNGTTSLRALLYMDEIYGYLPPSANPPSKRPMMTILKQGRAFGLGCLLATQNPVDLDYKALSNIGTWFLGRLQTERDKLRVLDGLEGAAGSQNAKFDRASMEKLISGLGNRVFLMNNVHEDAPVLFHVRWVMSYLTGPLTRGQIKLLMDPKRADFAKTGTPSATTAEANPMAMPGMSSAASASTPSARPNVGAGITEIFVPPAGGGDDIVYQPHLLRIGVVHFSSSKANLDGSRTVRFVNPITATGIDWEKTLPPPLKLDDKGTSPVDGASFGDLPGFAMNAANYKQVEKDFAEWLYRNERADIFTSSTLKEWSKLGESEADFRARIIHQAREVRDAAIQKLRDAAAKKINTLETRLRTAEGQLSKEKAESSSATMQAGVSVLGGILGSILGRKSGLGTVSRGTSAIGKATGAYKQRQDVANAEAKVEGVTGEIETIKAELETGIAKLTESYDPAAIPLETESIKPTKTDVKVQTVALLWLPCDARGDKAW